MKTDYSNMQNRVSLSEKGKILVDGKRLLFPATPSNPRPEDYYTDEYSLEHRIGLALQLENGEIPTQVGDVKRIEKNDRIEYSFTPSIDYCARNNSRPTLTVWITKEAAERARNNSEAREYWKRIGKNID